MRIVRSTILGGTIALGVLLGVIPNPVTSRYFPGPQRVSGSPLPAKRNFHSPQATTHSSKEQAGEFQRIEQPWWVKGAVTAGGLGLIGLELWWFLLSKPKSRSGTTQGGVKA